MGQAESICQVLIQSNDTQIFRERLQSIRSLPNFIQSLEDKTIQEGEKLVFQVQVNGQPKPQIIWYKNNKPLRNTNDHQVCFNIKLKEKRKIFFFSLYRFEMKMIFIYLKYHEYQ
jgi:hypothetical protein